MQVERFKAANLRDAMVLVKNRFGSDATILDTRTIAGNVEIIAAVEEGVKQQAAPWLAPAIQAYQELLGKKIEIENDQLKGSLIPDDLDELVPPIDDVLSGKYRPKNPPPPMAEKASEPKAAPVDDKREQNHKEWQKLMNEAPMPEKPKVDKQPEAPIQEMDPAQRTAEFTQILTDEIQTARNQREVWMEHEKTLNSLKQEIADLKEQLLQQELAQLKAKVQKAKSEKAQQPKSEKKPQKPADFFGKINVKLLERGIDEPISKKIIDKLKHTTDSLGLDLNRPTDIQIIKENLNSQIRNLIDTVQPPSLDKKRVICLVGAKDSGKTLSAIKLAIHNSIILQKSVALILATHSEGAVGDHLGQLSNAAGLPLALVNSPKDLSQAIASHNDKDVIIIDFAFGKLAEKTDVQELSKYIKVVPDSEVHLTIAADKAVDEIDNDAKRLNILKFESLILTKYDLEKPGKLLNILQVVNKPISYVCNGELIPDHIKIANPIKLTHAILRG